jgi:hypothetical protein
MNNNFCRTTCRFTYALSLFAGLIVAAGFPATLLAETCNGLQATIVGTDGNDVINGTNKMDVIVGLGGDDIINSGGGKDVVCAGDGDDIVNGGNGGDTIFGGAGDDQLNGDKGNDNLNGGLGNDQMTGGKGADNCDGYIGIDTGADCESETNIGLQVKQVQVPVLPDGFTPVGGELAGQQIMALDGALFVPRNSKKIAILATHSASGAYYRGTPGWLGWWMEQNRVAVLALNRRDSADYGAGEGGSGTIYEDTLCDAGLGVDYLISLGYEQVIIEGFSKGTTVAPMYPVHYNNCLGKTALTDPNDPNVAGVITNGTIRNAREAGLYAPFGLPCYDPNNVAANDLVSRGYSGVLFPPGGFSSIPPFLPEFGVPFCVFPPGAPFPFPYQSTPDSLLSYNDNPLRNTNETAKDLIVPYLIIHTEGDLATLRVWSDTLFAELQANGNDVEYFQQPYASLGYDLGFFGSNAHQIANQDARDEATAVIGNWASRNISGANAKATGIDQAAIDALPDFNPPLQPAPVVP